MKKFLFYAIFGIMFLIPGLNPSATSLPDFFTENFDSTWKFECVRDYDFCEGGNPGIEPSYVMYDDFTSKVFSNYYYSIKNNELISYSFFYEQPFAKLENGYYSLLKLSSSDYIERVSIYQCNSNWKTCKLNLATDGFTITPDSLSHYSTNFDLYTFESDLLISSSVTSNNTFTLQSQSSVGLIPKTDTSFGVYDFSYLGSEMWSGWYNTKESFFVRSTIFDLEDSTELKQSQFNYTEGFKSNYIYVIYNKSYSIAQVAYDDTKFDLIYFDSPNSVVTGPDGKEYSSPNFVFDNTIMEPGSIDLSELINQIPQILLVLTSAFSVITSMITIMFTGLPAIVISGFTVSFLLILVILVIKSLK